MGRRPPPLDLRGRGDMAQVQPPCGRSQHRTGFIILPQPALGTAVARLAYPREHPLSRDTVLPEIRHSEDGEDGEGLFIDRLPPD